MGASVSPLHADDGLQLATTGGRMRRRRGDDGSAAPWLVLTVLLVIPVVVLTGWWLVAAAENGTAAAAPVAAVVVPVAREDVRAEASVSVSLGEAPGFELTVTGQGTVTTPPTVGAVLDAGAEVLRVDDRPIRAMVADAPLWRALSPGDTGPDVVRLQEHLAALGYYDGAADGAFGAGLRRAVEAFNTDAGLGRRVPAFDPATVVWVGPEPLTVHEVLTTAGASITPGTAVARGPARPDAVTVTEPQGGIAGLGDFTSGATLAVADVEVPYVPGSGAVEPAPDVAAVSDALAPGTEGIARVSAVEARPVAVVPASALVQGADGTVCLYGAADARPVAVTPVGGGVGSAQLPSDLELDEVLTNPGRVDLAHPCGS